MLSERHTRSNIQLGCLLFKLIHLRTLPRWVVESQKTTMMETTLLYKAKTSKSWNVERTPYLYRGTESNCQTYKHYCFRYGTVGSKTSAHNVCAFRMNTDLDFTFAHNYPNVAPYIFFPVIFCSSITSSLTKPLICLLSSSFGR